ncbi:MAG TPA: hypothetical protein HPP97_08585 [Desulfuromonadales bacterium]|nr:hypothetical protein [Desulfuromonadales bacterium]
MKNLWMKMVIVAVFTLAVQVVGEVKVEAGSLVGRRLPDVIVAPLGTPCYSGYTCAPVNGMTVMTKGHDWLLKLLFFR